MKNLLFIILLGLTYAIGYSVGTDRYDHLDVNRDGEANLVDLSVLAAELNARQLNAK